MKINLIRIGLSFLVVAGNMTNLLSAATSTAERPLNREWRIDEKEDITIVGSQTKIPRRLVAISNKGLWPKLQLLKDGTLVVSIHGKPDHINTEADVECWASSDGGASWSYRGMTTRHAPYTAYGPGSVGVNVSGNLVQLSSGWDDIRPERNAKSRPLRAVVSLSKDGGKTWEVHSDGMPAAVPGMSEHFPFGKIYAALNGDLVAGTYVFDPAEEGTGKRSRGNMYAIRSKDGGRTWSEVRTIVEDTHVEAAMLSLGNGRWIAAGRRFGFLDLDIFISDDDAFSWRHQEILGIPRVSAADLLKLRDGRILLIYGNRSAGNTGIDLRVSVDNGLSWSGPQRLLNLDSRDLGYPSAVQMENGVITVAYYSSGIKEHRQYHMGVINLLPEEITVK